MDGKMVAKDGYMPPAKNGDMHYKPFGDSIETPVDPVGYTGHKFDTDLGLSYMQARYYDPVIGRFLSNDPVGYTAKNPVMSFNRYSYVSNNPYKYTDPNGQFQFVQSLVGGRSWRCCWRACCWSCSWGCFR
jgi:RHS repeat-associated protein